MTTTEDSEQRDRGEVTKGSVTRESEVPGYALDPMIKRIVENRMGEGDEMGKHKGIDGYIKSIEYALGQLKEKHEEMVRDAREKGWKAQRAWEDHIATLHGKPDCDTCVYSVFDWDGKHCDGCTKSHSNYKRDTFCVFLDAESLAEIEDEFGSAVVRKIREMCE